MRSDCDAGRCVFVQVNGLDDAVSEGVKGAEEPVSLVGAEPVYQPFVYAFARCRQPASLVKALLCF